MFDLLADCRQIECESLNWSQAFEPKAFEEPSENRVKARTLIRLMMARSHLFTFRICMLKRWRCSEFLLKILATQ